MSPKLVELWRSTADNIIKTFSWAKCSVFMGKLNCVLYHCMCKPCMHCSCSPLVTNSGIATKGLVICNKMIIGQSCELTVSFLQLLYGRIAECSSREALESILGGSLSGWFWTKASLLSRCGRINLRSTSVHIHAAFLASDAHSQALTESIRIGSLPSL